MKVFKFEFLWIPSRLGGHGSDPFEGMRTSIRWQKYTAQFLECARDVQWQNIEFNGVTPLGRATGVLRLDDGLPGDCLEDGALIEFLNGFRVLAVGRVVV